MRTTLDSRFEELAGYNVNLLNSPAGGVPQGGDWCAPLGVFRRYRSADYVVAVPEQSLIVFYTDGIVEHQRDILRGERELVAICRDVRGLGVSDAALAIADRVFDWGADTTMPRSSPYAAIARVVFGAAVCACSKRTKDDRSVFVRFEGIVLGTDALIAFGEVAVPYEEPQKENLCRKSL